MTTSNSTVAKLDKASQNTYDALIVGAGFAGMYMLYQLRSLGFTAKVIEAEKKASFGNEPKGFL